MRSRQSAGISQKHILQQLYNSEIDFTIITVWDCGFHWKLGSTMNGFRALGNADTLEGAADQLAQAAVKHYPSSNFARSYKRSRPVKSGRATRHP